MDKNMHVHTHILSAESRIKNTIQTYVYYEYLNKKKQLCLTCFFSVKAHEIVKGDFTCT